MKRTTSMLLMAVLAAAFLAVVPASQAANITLGSAIDGISPSGNGSSATPWVYNFGNTDLDWGGDTAGHTANAASWTTFTNVANVTSAGTGGTVNKGGSAYNGDVGKLVITASGSINIGGYLSTANTKASSNSLSDAGDMTITGPTSITIGADGSGYSLLAWANRSKGKIELFSSGAVTLAGGVKAHGSTQPVKGPGGLFIQQNSGGGAAGAVSIGGDLLLYHGVGDRNSGGPLSIISSGAVQISGDVLTYGNSGVGGAVWNGGDVNITAAGTVNINGVNGIDTRLTGTASNSGSHAGDVTIATTVGDVLIAGGFDLRLTTGSGGRSGRLSLTASHAAGGISVGSLDLANFQYAIFSAGGGDSYVLGDVLNFVDGTTKLRAAAGQKIYYDPGALANDYLNGLTYNLFAADGTSAGGVLTPVVAPVVPEPATLGLLAAGGLGLIGGAIRRRRRA